MSKKAKKPKSHVVITTLRVTPLVEELMRIGLINSVPRVIYKATRVKE